MLPAIGLDDQPRIVANEIGNERPDRGLAPKFERAETPVAQHVPETPFRFGRLRAHGAGVFLGGWIPLNPLGQARVALSRKGRGKSHATNPSGFSISALNALINSAPSAPSMARWSKLPVTLITVAIASAPPTT